MGQKLYIKSEGGIRFKSSRKPGEVRIPNYVYDLWVPLLGIETLGVYAVYCRLEREGTVKGMSMSDLAKACRIGKSKLEQINKTLEHCGFIMVRAPTGQARLMHWTNEIEILDPPQEITQTLITEYMPEGREHEILAPWLVEDEEIGPPEVPNGTAGGDNKDHGKVSNGTLMIESPNLQSSLVEEEGVAEKKPPLTRTLSDLPDADKQASLIFFGNGSSHPAGEQLIARAGWNIRNHDHRLAAAIFLEASGLDIPSKDRRKKRDFWLHSIDEHVKAYGVKQLETLYPRVIAQMRGDGLTVCQPESVTNNLADLWAKQKSWPAPAPLPPPPPPSAPDPLAVAWGRVLDDLSTQTAAPTFKAHFAGSQLIDRQNGDITVYLPNPDTPAWFRAKPSIENLLKQAVAVQMGDVRIAYTGVKP